ncbi:probable WRKY transcription factor 70 [Abrus precatorius]|uniref:Probable WRKY transcription factor 70 n=1 Tax=Abrus precatorius TaxID=3816 RepID=A0A8B8JRW0_ABRPR|nr:probable WRKY transcription factor 70 [Abrus precatorius]
MKIVSSETESVSANRERMIIRELVQGQEAATQLKVLLQKPFGSEGYLSSEELLANVLRSFNEVISIITSSSSELGSAGGVAHRNLLSSGENGSQVAGSGYDPTCEDSSESRKRSQKGGRGCYKRRKRAQTWTIVSYNTDDNYVWRKYGQKEIMNSEFPRSYFRCSHKYDEDCRATKQVQRDQENPDMYRTTYIGCHTCNATPKATNSITDSTTWESYLLKSDPNKKVPNDHDHHNISAPSLTIKQELPKEDTPGDVKDQKLDHSLWSELKDFEPYKPAINVPLKMVSDNGARNSQCLDMDFGVESVHFGSDFHFDESHFD